MRVGDEECFDRWWLLKISVFCRGCDREHLTLTRLSAKSEQKLSRFRDGDRAAACQIKCREHGLSLEAVIYHFELVGA
jgi:hypothetical protein